MDDKQFDRLINEALKNFQADHLPSHWDEFEHHLDEELDQDWNEFDSAIKDKVKNYSVNYEPGNWLTFERQLDQSLHEDYATELDNNVRRKLDNYQVAYDETTWPILERKIEERKAYIRRLIFTKSIEAAIVIFAIFTFYTYFPYFHQQFKNWKYNNENSFVESPQNLKTEESQTLSSELTYSNQTSTESAADEVFAYQLQNSGNTPIDISEDRSAEVIADASNTTEADNTGIQDVSVQQFALAVDEPAIRQARDQYSSSSLPTKQLNLSIDRSSKVPNLSYETTESSIATIAAVKKTLNKKPKFHRKELVRPIDPGKDIAFASLNHKLRPVIFNNFNNTKKKNIWSLGIYGSSDLNYINIPQDEYVDFEQRTFEFREKDLVEMGFGTGLSVNLRLGALSFETGINYAYKKYDPNKNYTPAEGFSQINYKRIHMDIVEVPINVQYRWDNEGRVKVYGVAGAAINAIAVSHHDLVIPQPTLRGHTRSSSENFEVLRVKSHFLKGDDARETFYTINLGMGVEYYLSERYTLFTEPLYKQQVLTKGIGPNQDKINTLSFKLGSRMSF